MVTYSSSPLHSKAFSLYIAHLFGGVCVPAPFYFYFIVLWSGLNIVEYLFVMVTLMIRNLLKIFKDSLKYDLLQYTHI